MTYCPDGRGDLIDDSPNGVWVIIFSTLATTAIDVVADSFEIIVTLADASEVKMSLAETRGVESGDRKVYTWTIAQLGDPDSGAIYFRHHTLGSLEHTLTISEMGRCE